MDSKTENDDIYLQQKSDKKDYTSRSTSFSKSVAYTQNALNKHTEKLAKHRRLQTTVYIWCFCIDWFQQKQAKTPEGKITRFFEISAGFFINQVHFLRYYKALKTTRNRLE